MSTAAPEGQEPNGANGGAGQEPPADQGAQGQEPGTQQAGGTGTDGADGQIDVEKITDPALKAFVIKTRQAAEEARKDAAKHRTEAQALQAKVTEQERANETAEQAAAREAQERDQRAKALENENRTLKVGVAVRTAAEAAKAVRPDAVLAMIGHKVTLDDQGKPTNVDALLADLRQTDPYMFKRTSNDGGQGRDTGEPTGDTMNDRIRGMAGRG